MAHVHTQYTNAPYFPESSMTYLSTKVDIFHTSNYNLTPKEIQKERDASVAERLERLKKEYAEYGMRRFVEIVMVVQEHRLPHLYLLQLGTNFFKLPGGELNPGEDELEGVRRLLTTNFAPDDGSAPIDWDIVDTVGNWWRPNFDSMQYPYIQSHMTQPKEQRKLVLVQLPSSYTFHVPRNQRLVPIPLFDLVDAQQQFGPIISVMPQLLSRYTFVFR
eukprot:Colp12_sorted_trinity150504_noHs@28029